MNLAATMPVLEAVERRILGALRFVDAVSGLPVNGSMRIEARGALLIRPSGNTILPLVPGKVQFLQNRLGLFVIKRAPLFDDYANEFMAPAAPDSLQNSILRLRLALVTTDANYLPQEFDYDLPRSLAAGPATVYDVPLKEAAFSIPITGGQITVNGQAVAVRTDDTLTDVFAAIATATNGAVTGAYDTAADQIILTGKITILLGSAADTSNFLVAARLSTNGRQVVCSHGRVRGSIFLPLDIPLFRSTSARAESSWVILRTRVVKAGTGKPLPGVLVRVYRSPRTEGDTPIGMGLSDWRDRTIGEALVAVADIPRFRPGSGATVVETEQPVEFEAVRNPSFTGVGDQLPHCTSLLSGSGPGQIISPSSSAAIQPPAEIMNVRAGAEYIVTLTMP